MRASYVLSLLLLGAGQTAQADGLIPLRMTFEASVGPYIPDTEVGVGFNAVDISTGGNAFNCAFGFGVRPIFFLHPQLSVFDLFGTVNLGLEVGGYHVWGRQLTNAADCNSNQGTTTNQLTILPIMATATYRFDWALEKFGVPLVPYARIGLGGAGYVYSEDGNFVRSNEAEITQRDGTKIKVRRDPIGFSFGGKLAVGMMVALDFLEPLRALRARAGGIYKHSFVFAEVAAFDAGWAQNILMSYAQPNVQSYFGPTLIVGAERLPLLTAGLAIAF